MFLGFGGLGLLELGLGSLGYRHNHFLESKLANTVKYRTISLRSIDLAKQFFPSEYWRAGSTLIASMF